MSRASRNITTLLSQASFYRPLTVSVFPDSSFVVNPDIVIVRDGDAYRLLHGHLRLANVLRESGEVCVDVQGEGHLKITRIRNQYLVGKDGRRLPLRVN